MLKAAKSIDWETTPDGICCCTESVQVQYTVFSLDETLCVFDQPILVEYTDNVLKKVPFPFCRYILDVFLSGFAVSFYLNE